VILRGDKVDLHCSGIDTIDADERDAAA